MTVGFDITGTWIPGLDAFELIGRGGHAAVYRAIDAELGRTVAVKVLGSRPSGDGTVHTVPPEARVLAALSGVSHILALHSHGVTTRGEDFLVLEYAPGGSLADRVDRTGPLSRQEWYLLADELTSALTQAHRRGVLHCDVKPSNLLLAEDGSLRVADFGIARVLDATTRSFDGLRGSLPFLPPELLDGARPSEKSDVYAAALSLVFAATGRTPFSAPGDRPALVMARLGSERINVDTAIPWAPPDLRGTLQRALSRDPARRPSMAVLRHSLASPRRVGEDVDRPIRSQRWMAGLAIGVVAALAGTVLVAARWEGERRAAQPPDLCRSFRESIERRTDLMGRVSADLEQSPSPVRVVERMLVSYPPEQAEVMEPVLRDVARLRSERMSVTIGQLADLTVAEAARSLGGGKPFLFDGQSGAFDPTSLPPELRAQAEAVSDAHTEAARRCPEVRVDLLPAKARMNSAIRSNLSDPQFIDAFFGDPRSIDLLDGTTVLILMSSARTLFEGLLSTHWDWLVELLDRQPDLGSSLAVGYPDLILTALRERPDLLERIKRPEWTDALARGIERSGPSSRLGMEQLFGEQIRLLGLGGT